MKKICISDDPPSGTPYTSAGLYQQANSNFSGGENSNNVPHIRIGFSHLLNSWRHCADDRTTAAWGYLCEEK